MKIVRFKDVKKDKKSDGRTVRKLLSHTFNKPVDSIAFYICEVPSGKFGEHHHSESEEIIMFPHGGKITVNEKTYEMDNWDFVLLEQGDTHGFDGECEDIIHLAMKFPDVDDKVVE